MSKHAHKHTTLPDLTSAEELSIEYVHQVGTRCVEAFANRNWLNKLFCGCCYDDTLSTKLLGFSNSSYKPYMGWTFLINVCMEERVISDSIFNSSNIAHIEFTKYFKQAFGKSGLTLEEMHQVIIDHFTSNEPNVAMTSSCRLQKI